MLNASDAYREKATGTADTLFRAVLTLADGTSEELVGDDVDMGSIEFDDAVSGSGSFDLGAAVISQMTLRLNNRDRRFDTYDFEGSVIVPSIGVQLGNTVEWLVKGVYLVEQPKSYGSTIRLSCYDKLALFERDYRDVKTSYPATLGKIVADMCAHCGVALATKTFQHSGYTVRERPSDENVTCLEMLSYAAQVAGCFCDCDQLGRLRVRWYDGTAFGTESVEDGGTFNTPSTPYSDGDAADGGGFMSGGAAVEGGAFSGSNYANITAVRQYTAGTADKVVTGLWVTASDKDMEDGEQALYGSDGYVLKISDNPLVECGRASEVADMLGPALVGMSFRQLDVSSVGDPTIEAGDAVQVTDRLARVYRAFATRVVWRATGTTVVKCEAEDVSRVDVRRRRTSQQRVADLARVEAMKAVELIVPNLVNTQVTDLIMNDVSVQAAIGSITVQVPEVNVPVIHGLDGLDYALEVDINGNLVATPVATKMIVIKPPKKLIYKQGETIDYSGIMVWPYDALGNAMDQEVPFDELRFSSEVAALDAGALSGVQVSKKAFIEYTGSNGYYRKIEYEAFDDAIITIFRRGSLTSTHDVNMVVISLDNRSVIKLKATHDDGYQYEVYGNEMNDLLVSGDDPGSSLRVYTYGCVIFAEQPGDKFKTSPSSNIVFEYPGQLDRFERTYTLLVWSLTHNARLVPISVYWTEPNSGAVLKDRFYISVSLSEGWVDQVIDTVNQAIENNSQGGS